MDIATDRTQLSFLNVTVQKFERLQPYFNVLPFRAFNL